MKASQLLGLVSQVRVRHVYAGDLFSVMLIDSEGHETGDDLTLSLPVAANSYRRESDAPLMALRLYDPDADRGRGTEALGPCPRARRAASKLIRSAKQIIMHVPIPPRRDWLDALTPGAPCIGEIFLLPTLGPDPLTSCLNGAVSLSEELVRLNHATKREPIAA